MPRLCIIGGHFRGRRLNYHGDPVVRPMKHRTREAIFNLISTGCQGRHAIDLFAGTGALGLEAISRGSPSATFIEKHVPTVLRIVEENIRTLGVEDRTTLVVTSAFLWARRDLPDASSVGRTILSVRKNADEKLSHRKVARIMSGRTELSVLRSLGSSSAAPPTPSSAIASTKCSTSSAALRIRPGR